jgi:hypothetical protein
MAVTLSNVANPLGTLLVTDTDANGTAEENATGGTGTIYSVQIDNTLNTSGVYLKIADNAMAGTTSQDQAPNWVYYAPAGQTVTYACPGGSAFGTALSFWATTVKPSFAGVNETQTDPTNGVVVKILVG